MRLVFKSLIALVCIIVAINYFPRNYSPKITALDVSLKHFISSFGLKKENLQKILKQKIKKSRINYIYIGREYSISPDFPLKQFEKNLRNFLKKKGFRLKKELYGSRKENIRYEISFKKLPVYTLSFSKKNKGYLAIVLDDWGYNATTIPYISEIKIPLNISILPKLKYSRIVSITAAKYGDEVLLHLPMQPLASEKMEKHLEKSTLKENMTKDEIEKIISVFLSSLKNVKGVNNHMGSLLSKNRVKMSQILKVLKKRGLYFLDSKVIADSVIPDVARKVGITCFQRNIFLDNKENTVYIKNQIRKAIRLSKKKGYAVAIGHDKIITLKTIQEMTPEILENAYPVKLSNLK